MAGADAVVIGAGAAGIAAARTLHDAGRDVLLIEAGDRLGGRAWSVGLRSPALLVTPAKAGVTDGWTVDMGCGWLHSAARNPWTTLAGHYGLTVDRSSPNWDEQWRDLGFPPAEQTAADDAWARWSAAAHAALHGPDQPLAEFVAADDPWRPLIDAISGYANGAPLAQVSLHDWAAYEDAAGDHNWAVCEGYGTLVARHAAELPVRLGTPVTCIDHRGARVRVETAGGTIETAAVIVCVPTTALASDALTFDPPLPDKTEAAAALPLGLADKVFLHVAGSIEWPANAHLIGNPHRAATASHRLSPFGWPIVESFFGGDCAADLEADGAGAAFAIEELVALLGSEWRTRLTPLAATRWRQHPYIYGSYSHARVGHAGARATLAEPVDARLFFAGEACSPRDFSTAHGAYQTGVAAARSMMMAAATV